MKLLLTRGFLFLLILMLLTWALALKKQVVDLSNSLRTADARPQRDEDTKYATPYTDCIAPTETKTLHGRKISKGIVSLSQATRERKTISINVFIASTGFVKGKPLQVATEDFQLKDLDLGGALATPTNIFDHLLKPCELPLPPRSQQLILSDFGKINGNVSYIVPSNSNNFELVYAPSNLTEQASFQFSTVLPISR